MSKKVLISDIKRAVKINGNDKISIRFGSGDNVIEAEFKKRLTLSERSIFVNMVVAANFIGKDGQYTPQYFHIAFVQAMLQLMSNISLPEIKDENGKYIGVDLEKLQEWDNVFDFCETVRDTNEFRYYLVELYEDCENLVEFKKQSILKHSKVDDLVDKISEVISNYKNQLDGVDVNKVLKNIQSMNNIDEKKIVHAIAEEKKVSK